MLITRLFAYPTRLFAYSGAHYHPEGAAAAVKDAILRHLAALQSAKPASLLRERYAKFRQFGVVEESVSA